MREFIYWLCVYRMYVCSFYLPILFYREGKLIASNRLTFPTLLVHGEGEKSEGLKLVQIISSVRNDVRIRYISGTLFPPSVSSKLLWIMGVRFPYLY